jgi:hypothetical protein
MIEAFIISFIASFMVDNIEFLNIKKQQEEAGYVWVYKPKARDPNLPAAFPIKKPDGSERVLWVLEK